MHVFLTGPVQIGKSTLIAAALDQLQPERLGGFRTISDAPAADGSRSVHLFRASEHPQDHICTSANRVGIRRPGLGIASFPAVFDAVGIGALTVVGQCLGAGENAIFHAGKKYDGKLQPLYRMDGHHHDSVCGIIVSVYIGYQGIFFQKTGQCRFFCMVAIFDHAGFEFL